MARNPFKRLFNRRSYDEAPVFTSPLPYQKKDLSAHLAPAGRKRILALDGGGVRGAMSIAMLERIEDILRKRHDDHPDFRLCDYFDLIGGTSTGSIIASGLAAKRFSASEIRDFYFDMGPAIFKKRPLRLGLARPVFKGKILLKKLDEVFGETTLGSDTIATGLAMISKRVDTASTWVLHNHPGGQFFLDPPSGDYIGNRHFPLKNVIRASTAAPHFFKPEKID